MSDEKLDRLEKMMEQLIRIVGNGNAAIEELRQEVKEIKSAMATKQELAEVKANMATKQDIKELKAEIKTLKESDAAIIELIQESYRDLDDKFSALNDRIFFQETQLSD
ncbi:MAG TPA: hypothetical protein PKA28_11430 [Methylomusa anaerophila]|uniref:Chromosome partition protein Smc n=1 Tax=Methylomusa anaerophila TaxID=1930071 RepID=A0A348AJC0_9FIRM|nr:hypothetical protein [Methylomusa anaerophila]BBB91168.1 hypothetical protein MAMMFC1_01839 [Methylomusa anaerophila]HML89045.1 hypothetical protein [Methylomusa anaerophila]